MSFDGETNMNWNSNVEMNSFRLCYCLKDIKKASVRLDVKVYVFRVKITQKNIMVLNSTAEAAFSLCRHSYTPWKKGVHNSYRNIFIDVFFFSQFQRLFWTQECTICWFSTISAVFSLSLSIQIPDPLKTIIIVSIHHVDFYFSLSLQWQQSREKRNRRT